MTLGRLFGIAIIFLCTTLGWFVLGATVHQRTAELDGMLVSEVETLWGGKHVQHAPTAHYEVAKVTQREVTETTSSGPVTRVVDERTVERVPLPLANSRVEVGLALDHRRKGLLWYDTYEVAFSGRYAIRNPDPEPRKVSVHFAFPSPAAIYDGFRFTVNGVAATNTTDLSTGVTTTVELAPGATAPIEIAYRSRGLDVWHYSFGDGVAQIADFELVVHTDFAAIDYPPGTMSASSRTRDGDGWRLGWKFDSLVSGNDIGIDLPARTNPGPLAARIAFFAPVGLLFFITVMVILGVLRGRSLHPMNYFFLTAGFFAFHLLLAYLVDHVDIHAAFGISTVVSVALVVSYLRLVAGRRFVVIEAAIAQLVFLVLFSYAFFFEGYTGLTVTAGAVLTLFVLMQVTGRVDWANVFAKKQPPMPANPMPPFMPPPPPM